VEVRGLTEKPDKSLLTAIFTHQALAQTSTFTCSDETLNKIWSAGIRSTLSNTFYSLTDCPTREKLGWTNDAQASLEQFLYNFEGEKLLEKWLIDICDTMNADGDLSGVAPSPDWGYGHGPVCNGIIFTLPYLLYKYCGNYSAVEYALPYMTRYYEYLKAHLGESSLGDWTGYRFYATPIDFIEKTYLYMFASIFVELEKDYTLECEKWQNDLERYIENGRCVVDEQCAISALIVLGIGDEKTLGAQLVENVEKADRHMKTGMFGAQFLYKALEKIGRTDLAYCAITNPCEPSFRVWIEQGATTLWESFDTDAHTLSKNHHMFSNVLYFFVESICGAKRLSKNRYNVCAKFVPQLSFAECSRVGRDGVFSVKWERENGTVKVTLSASGEVVLEYKNVKIESGTRVFYIEEK
jgi:alpha-L-rhamnosidase